MQAQHINPGAALKIYRDLNVRASVGIWGSFEMTDEALDEAPKALARAREQSGLPPGRFIVPRHGQTLLFR